MSKKVNSLFANFALNSIILVLSLVAIISYTSKVLATQDDAWFESFKQTASDEQLYRLLYAMPKGGDLHNHISGSNFSEWWYELATNQSLNGGYRYYVKTALKHCQGYGLNQFGSSPSLLLFVNIQHSTFDSLPVCQQSEFTAIEALSEEQKEAWMKSIWLDKPHEGREEFFQAHWQRLNALTANPYIAAEMLVKNMQAFGAEGLIYLEAQANASHFKRPDGSHFPANQVANIYRNRLAKKDAIDTGVTVRLQHSIIRFLPHAEQILEQQYRFVNQHRDLYVGLNFVGREDNDKGHPLRFLPTLRKLRKTLPEVKLSIHAGEVDEPNYHVRDTLLLGADRIGHGLNLITDPDTMRLMRHNHYLIEINLISNLKLEYINTYADHPFPEYLRTGIPVALSTDDRGMWHSNMTDEFFVAVKEFGLTWSEINYLSENSIKYSFLDKETKSSLLSLFKKRMETFTKKVKSNRSSHDKSITTGNFICTYYEICLDD
ncbi:adenosine deaminase family protein [Glaciecola petra]|uniref:Adenosine deaminase n=1 Tax=Glaciecola petra TaxID=3075602 RepID=A0ABU2ZTT5_9ALTE|nr:adenosine deaminase [Aestuariibacter sp. P117]MDT0595734.1 adenosine deaminase [Aestuariibacter sp. P117]